MATGYLIWLFLANSLLFYILSICFPKPQPTPSINELIFYWNTNGSACEITRLSDWRFGQFQNKTKTFEIPISVWGGGENEDKVHLSPAEAEIGVELGNIIDFISSKDLTVRYNDGAINFDFLLKGKTVESEQNWNGCKKSIRKAICQC